MSAVSSEFGATERRSGPEPPEESLSRQAKAYLFTVAAIAVAAALVPLSHLKPGTHGWPTFLPGLAADIAAALEEPDAEYRARFAEDAARQLGLH